MRLILIAIFFLVTHSASYANEASPAHEEAVQEIKQVIFKEYHDPGWMLLEDDEGNELEASFYYKFISFEEIQNWEAGESLKVVYSPEDGFGLFRQKDSSFYKVIFEDKGLDSLLERQCMDEPVGGVTRGYSTIGISSCKGESADRWKVEYQARLSYLLENSSDDLKETLIAYDKAQAQNEEAFWSAYRTHTTEMGGTRYAVIAAGISKKINYDKAAYLIHFYE